MVLSSLFNNQFCLKHYWVSSIIFTILTNPMLHYFLLLIFTKDKVVVSEFGHSMFIFCWEYIHIFLVDGVEDIATLSGLGIVSQKIRKTSAHKKYMSKICYEQNLCKKSSTRYLHKNKGRAITEVLLYNNNIFLWKYRCTSLLKQVR